MKTVLAILIYTAITQLPFDVVLGIIAGGSFAMLCAIVFIGPSQAPRQNTSKPATKNTVKAAQSVLYQVQHGVRIFNYPVTEWSAA